VSERLSDLLAFATAEELAEIEALGMVLGSHIAPIYRRDPVAFAHDFFAWPQGQGLVGYQEEILTELVVNRRACVRAPHSAGKSSLAAVTVLWYACTRDGDDWKIPTTASAWRQLTHYLWPEIHKWARMLRWDKLGRKPFDKRKELMGLALRLGTGEAFAVASDEPSSLEGAHADHLAYVLDEAKAIIPATFDAVEGAFAQTGESYALAISTPGEPSGRFFEIQARKPGTEDWWVRHITLDEAIAAGRINPKWAEDRKRQWGERSAVYMNRVLGEFCTSDEDGVVPLSWVEAAQQRWLDWADSGGQLDPLSALGVDVARGGEDDTVIVRRHGNVVLELSDRLRVPDLMVIGGRTAGILNKAGTGVAVVDVGGVGAGVFDFLRDKGWPAVPFNASERTFRKDSSGELGFADARSAMMWSVREILDPAAGFDLCLPPDDRLTGDLCAPHWKVVAGGKIKVESKDEIRKRLGRSTDAGDSVGLSLWADGITGADYTGLDELAEAAW
jgi:hypothetical protein